MHVCPSIRELMSLMGGVPIDRTPRDADPLSALVFKVEDDGRGRIVWARVFGGALRVRDRVDHGPVHARVTGLEVSAPRGIRPPEAARAGDVVRLRGFARARIGDWLGVPDPSRPTVHFAAPMLESVVDPVHATERGAIFSALSTLAEQDPLIALRVDEDRGEVSISLHGDVQKEVITALLTEQFGIEATFRPTTARQIERIIGTGAAHAVMGDPTNGYLATLGFMVRAGEIGAGIKVELAVERGSMPPAFFAATREGVEAGLAQGRYGWPIPDARITITHFGYAPRQSHAHQKFNKAMSSVGADFRLLAPQLIHRALAQAGTIVCEPVDTFTIDTSTDTVDARHRRRPPSRGHRHLAVARARPRYDHRNNPHPAESDARAGATRPDPRRSHTRLRTRPLPARHRTPAHPRAHRRRRARRRTMERANPR